MNKNPDILSLIMDVERVLKLYALCCRLSLGLLYPVRRNGCTEQTSIMRGGGVIFLFVRPHVSSPKHIENTIEEEITTYRKKWKDILQRIIAEKLSKVLQNFKPTERRVRGRLMRN